MTSRFSIKSILALSVVFVMSMMSSTAGAYDIKSSNFTSCTYDAATGMVSCSIAGNAVLRGLRNVVRTPVAYKVTLRLDSGAVFCTNPADNASPANGVPFDSSSFVVGGEAITPDLISKNGWSLASIVFEDPELIASLPFTVDCQNANWLQRIIVTSLRAYGQIVTQDSAADPTCNLTSDPINLTGCTPVDNEVNDCSLPEPYFSDPAQALDTVVPYSCDEVCHDSDPFACNINTAAP